MILADFSRLVELFSCRHRKFGTKECYCCCYRYCCCYSYCYLTKHSRQYKALMVSKKGTENRSP